MTTRYKMTSLWLDGQAMTQPSLFGDATPSATWAPKQVSSIQLPVEVITARTKSDTSAWAKVEDKGRPIAVGDHVRILATDAVAEHYPDVYRGAPGVAVAFTNGRWLVDYLPCGGYGRLRVLWTHLERIEREAPDVVV